MKQEKVTYLLTTAHLKYAIDHSLNSLETVLNPAQFFPYQPAIYPVYSCLQRHPTLGD